jgi:hypothetical protein
LRQNAAYAVRHLHDLSSVFYLIKLIDDPSEQTRMQAMRGLQELLKPGVEEGSGWIPGTLRTKDQSPSRTSSLVGKPVGKLKGESKYGK